MLLERERNFLRLAAETADPVERLRAYRECGCCAPIIERHRRRAESTIPVSDGEAKAAMDVLLARKDALDFLHCLEKLREQKAWIAEQELMDESIAEARIDAIGRMAMKRGLVLRLKDDEVKPAAYATLSREAKQIFGTPTTGGMSADAALAAMHRLQELEAQKNPEAPAPPTPTLPPKEGESIGRA